MDQCRVAKIIKMLKDNGQKCEINLDLSRKGYIRNDERQHSTIDSIFVQTSNVFSREIS